MNKQNIKCLFGHHIFDDLWHSTHQYNSIQLCSNCKAVGRFVENRIPYRVLGFNFQAVTTETVISLIMQSPVTGQVYRYPKIGDHQLGVPEVCNE